MLEGGQHVDNLCVQRSEKVEMTWQWVEERRLAKQYMPTTDYCAGHRTKTSQALSWLPKNRPVVLTLALEL